MSDKGKAGLSLVFDSKEDLQKSLENNVAIIHQQCQEIQDLKNELDAVTTERDMLLCEVSKLKFEMEIADLKRLHDGWYVLALKHIQFTACKRLMIINVVVLFFVKFVMFFF
jgi:hypothetical protein